MDILLPSTRLTKAKAIANFSYNAGGNIIRETAHSNIVISQIRDITLTVRKSTNTNFFKPKDIITYTLVIINTGTTQALNVVIDEQLKNQKLIKNSFIFSNTTEADYYIEEYEDNLKIKLSKIVPNQLNVITYKTIVDEFNSINENITSTAKVCVDDLEPFFTNTITLKQKYANIVCEKENIEFIYTNKLYSYIIHVKNIGNETANDVEIIESLPDNYYLEKVLINNIETKDYFYNDSINILTIPLNSVNSSENVDIEIIGKVN